MSPSQRSGINSTETSTPPMHTPEAPTSTALLATQQKLNAGTGASKEEHKNRMPGKSVPRGRSAQHNNERQKPTIHTTKNALHSPQGQGADVPSYPGMYTPPRRGMLVAEPAAFLGRPPPQHHRNATDSPQLTKTQR